MTTKTKKSTIGELKEKLGKVIQKIQTAKKAGKSIKALKEERAKLEEQIRMMREAK